MERIIVGTQYAEVVLGLYVVRGENVVLLGEVRVQIRDYSDPPPASGPASQRLIRALENSRHRARKPKPGRSTAAPHQTNNGHAANGHRA